MGVVTACCTLSAKDVLRTDRETSLYKDGEGVKIKQMEDILRTYLIYNVDLGGCVSGCGLTGILTCIGCTVTSEAVYIQ